MESSIIRQGEQEGEGGGLSGHSTCTSQWAAGADRAAERRDMVWRSWNLWFDICSVWESVRGQEKVFEGTAASSRVRASGFYQRDLTCRAQRVAEQHCAQRRWSTLNGCWTDVIHQAKSFLLIHVGRGKPAHLRSSKTVYNSGSST